MVKKLLMEYNLSMSDIDTTEKEQKIAVGKSEDMSSGSMYGNHWKYDLLGIAWRNGTSGKRKEKYNMTTDFTTHLITCNVRTRT